MPYYIPENLDTDNLFATAPATIYGNRKFQKEHLLTTIDLLFTLPARKKDIISDEGYTPLCGLKLKDHIYGHRHYFEYLMKVGVIESDGYYVTSANATQGNPAKCLGYRFTKTYQTFPKKIEIGNGKPPRFKKRIKKISERKRKTYNHLNRWFNDKLQMDAEAAREYLKKHYDNKKDRPELWEWKKNKAEKKNPKDAFIYSNIAVDLFEAQDFYFDTDQTSRRLHSNITNLRKELRNFITYDGQHLEEIDLSNSQPYLLIILFEQSFWKNEHEYLNSKYIRQNKVIKEIKKGKYGNTIGEHMIDKLAEIKDSQGFQEYQSLVSKGTFYDTILNDYVDIIWDDGIFKREDLKSEFIRILFSGNHYSSATKKILTQRFPEVMKFLSWIKEGDKCRIAHLLQSIESTIFLLKATRRIYQQRPELPIYTIHDGIATTLGNGDFIHQILFEELSNCVGSVANFKRSLWHPTNITYQFKPTA